MRGFTEYRPTFNDGQRVEYPPDVDFIPQDGRTYYQVDHNGRPEALVAVIFSRKDTASETAISLGRILPKDNKAAPGWWYIREVICNECPSRAVNIVIARLESNGGRNSFKCLEEKYPAAVEVTNKSSAKVYVEKLCRG